MRKSDRERYSKIIEQDDRAVGKIDRALEKAERRGENKELKRFENRADREMKLYNRDTKRAYW